MKGFHRTKLIPPLAASAMLAVTLAPLPGFLAPANVYAATPPNNVHITGPALLNKSTGKVSVLIKYRCSPTDPATMITVDLTEPPGGSNTGSGTSTSTPKCNTREHTTSVTVAPDTGSTFTKGTATATATLGDTESTSQTRTILIK